MLPNPVALSALWTADAPDIKVFVTFDMPMDTSVLPDTTSFIITDNGVPLPTLAVDWITTDTLEIVSDGGIPETEPIDIDFPAIDQNLRDNNKHLSFPFSFTGIPEA